MKPDRSSLFLAWSLFALFLTACTVRGPLGGTVTYTPPAWLGASPAESSPTSGASKTPLPSSPDVDGVTSPATPGAPTPSPPDAR